MEGCISMDIDGIPAALKDEKLLRSVLRTQQLLGKYVSRPPLVVKYLVQPPFLYFHDIITSIIRKTGFLGGLFTPEELNRYQARSTKANRTKFMDKLIRTLHMTSGNRLRTFPLVKVSCGQRPLMSNYILQSIGKALDCGMNSDLAVKKINGELTSSKCGIKRKTYQDDLNSCDLNDINFYDGELEFYETWDCKKYPKIETEESEDMDSDEVASLDYDKQRGLGLIVREDTNYVIGIQDGTEERTLPVVVKVEDRELMDFESLSLQ